MTREEAHRILSNGLVNAPSEHEWCMAFDMAIKALEQEPVYFPPCVDCNTKMNEIREAYDKLKNQEPCEDAISREEAFEALNSLNGTAELDMAFEVIEKLPSVIPTRKKGHWVKEYIGCMYDVCSECGQKMTTGYFEYEYCPNCGTKMRGGEVENDSN